MAKASHQQILVSVLVFAQDVQQAAFHIRPVGNHFRIQEADLTDRDIRIQQQVRNPINKSFVSSRPNRYLKP